MTFFLVINCAISLANCHLPSAPEGVYAGQPVLVDMAPLQVCETFAKRADGKNLTLTNKTTHTVCVPIQIDNTGGFDAEDAEGGASFWVPVIATSDANASAADGPPAGLVPGLAFTNNARCTSQLPKVVPGQSYPVCAKVEVFGAGQ
jgi:hypothetical protein